MPVKPPAQLFRVDHIDVVRVERDLQGEPVIHYRDREVVKEVEKVVYKDDPKLLEQLNKVLKENGELKQALAKLPQFAAQQIEPKLKLVEKVVNVEKPIRNIKEMIIVAAASAMGSALLCYLILK